MQLTISFFTSLGKKRINKKGQKEWKEKKVEAIKKQAKILGYGYCQR